MSEHAVCERNGTNAVLRILDQGKSCGTLLAQPEELTSAGRPVCVCRFVYEPELSLEVE